MRGYDKSFGMGEKRAAPVLMLSTWVIYVRIRDKNL